MRKLLLVLLAGLLINASPVVVAAESDSNKAINFQFTDITGRSVQLSDFKGQWVLVNFWAPWCPLCWVEVPALNELNKRKDFVVIGIGLDYGPDENIVKETAQRHNLDFNAVIAGGSRRNPDSPFRQVGPVDFYPTSYLYDPNGEIVMFIPGQVKTNTVMAFMDGWNQKKNVLLATSETRRAPMPAVMQTAMPIAIPVAMQVMAAQSRVAAPVMPIKEVVYSRAPVAKAKISKPKATKLKPTKTKSKVKPSSKRPPIPLKNKKTVTY